MKWKFNQSSLIKELELQKSPVIIRVNKFSEDSAKEFHSKIALAHNTGQKVIPVIIDSYGGQVYSLMAMISAIKHSELPVATIVEGKAMSCGAILFSFGEEGMRYIDPDATVMIHDVSSGQFGKIEELKANAAESERLNQKVYQMMARNTGKADNYFLKKIHEKGHADWFLDADECKKIGLANHLRIPTLSVNITVEIDLE
jgi:ATP-dependent Clp protease, protease subunit